MLQEREASRTDHSTLSNYAEASASHVDLEWTVDFERHVISGAATFSVKTNVDGCEAFVVDTAGGLAISRVTVDGAEAKWSLGAAHAVLGTPASVSLGAGAAAGRAFRVRFEYATDSRRCTAAQWLAPQQTADKKFPYMFTQCQAIHARSLLPCQDTPGTKLTWTAAVTAPKWATALMSGLSDTSKPRSMTKSHWRQDIRTSTYLIAIVCADLDARDISGRCRVWSERSMVDAAALEFSQTEDFLRAAEAVTGLPYAWGRYDLVCLAPSFPYGGMENPCLTFVTPTLLACDKSLAGVVAHEIAHSWAGNLVTNATWAHFWLNEGWTRWLERNIKASVDAGDDEKRFKQLVDFDLASSFSALRGTVDDYVSGGEAGYTALVAPLEGGIDPDDVFSLVPYEKGSALLHTLERLAGRKAFGAFVQAYLKRFAGETLTSADFRAFALEQLPAARGFDWDAWFHVVGMPPPHVGLDETLEKRVARLADAWAAPDPSHDALRTRGQDTADWTHDEVEAFLDRLVYLAPGADALALIDARFAFSESANAEVRSRWCKLLLAAGVEAGAALTLAFITQQGRMKFVRPLYRALALSSLRNARPRARRAFLEHADFYHPICRKMVAADLGLLPGQKRLGAWDALALNRRRALAAALAGAALVFAGAAARRRA